MNLRSISLKVTYRSVDCDILNEFLIPCMQNSVIYKRAVGYFTSASLAEAARGLVGFVRNGGRMLLVASPRLTQEDIEKIKNGYSMKDAVESTLLRDIEIPLSEINSSRVKNLTWMIANNKLDIRIARPIDASGEESGLYHEKIGIFYDSIDEENSNKIAFSGSMNETSNGLITNYESIDVSITWDNSERELRRVEGHIKHFNNLWSGKETGLETIDFPEAVKRRLLIKYKPEIAEHEPGARRTLRSYQEQAIKNWEKADFKGVLSMATGSGKTLVALRSLEKCQDSPLSLIIVPSVDLAKQWEEEIEKEYPHSSRVRLACSEEANWQSQINNLIQAFLNNAECSKRNFVITTLQTASREKFLSLIGKVPSAKIAMVVDEVHHSGAPEFSKIFEIDCLYKLGLSATPERSWDDEGNQAIFDYFGPQVFEYSMSDAIRDDVLTKYNYLIHPVPLTMEEKESFREISHQIAVTLGAARSKYPQLKTKSIPGILDFLERTNKELSMRLRQLYLNRVGLIKKAENKKDALRGILKKYDLKRALIYCNDLDHLDECQKIIFSEGFEVLEFSSRIASDERNAVKLSFAKETSGKKFLIAVKCLDEGVDLPVCDSAILISCSRSTREFIQRRGRVLRKHPSKTVSTIHDIMVLPYTSEQEAYALSQSEYDFVMAELARSEEFATNALNKESIRIDELKALFRKHSDRGE